ncbi:hypothetical protein [Leptolyngbya sp. 7M]|uniref:hypothetical protein n=1 Tax=Leptolyngbya sp. 7M TaxID=2812896 RepID=UPI001B8C6FF4|nr:hypothetical protein [Leptolyngbya sp. 7M]QYO66892.1 hypothetical protein JVX88_08835 [Leptolyngbya sp. 7M]
MKALICLQHGCIAIERPNFHLDEHRGRRHLIRLTTKREPIEQALESVVRGRGEIEVLSCSEPVRLHPVEGFTQKVVRFTTDIPHMPNWGKPLLLGPGSILVAHTKDEFVLKKDLEMAVEQYASLVKRLLVAETSD